MGLTFYEINLQKLAMVATASSLWRKEDIQSKLKQYFYPYVGIGKEEFLIRLIKEVMQKVDPNSVTSVLYSELLLVIKEIGYKMSNWFYYIRRGKAFRDMSRKELYDKFLQDVYFTHYGTIDELKILKLSWMKIPNVDPSILYIMACYYCSEDLINELWQKVPENQFYSYKHLCKRFGFHLVAYWNKRRESDLGRFFYDCIVPNDVGDGSVYDSTQSIDVNMFRLAVRKGYVRAVKFFGSRISNDEKERNVKYCLTRVLNSYYEKQESEFYRREQCTEISLYMLNFLRDHIKKEIFHDLKRVVAVGDGVRYIDTFLAMFIHIWPWQECFKFVFNSVKELVYKFEYFMCISLVISVIKYNFQFGVPSENSIAQRQLHQLWYSTPPHWKASIAEDLNLQPLLFGDFSSAKMILNDKQLVTIKPGLMKNVHNDDFYLLGKENKYILQRFINEILVSPEWDENVQGIIRTIYRIVMDGDVDSVNKLLEFSSEEIKSSVISLNSLKMLIDHELMCYYLITKNKYELADKFLKWKFDKKENIEKHKRTFHDNDFTTFHIQNLWKTSKENVKSAQMNSDKFLLWFLEKETEVILFKIKRFVNKMFEHSWFTSWRFVDPDNFEILEDFLYWCNLNEDAIEQVKRNIIKYSLKYSIKECMRENSIEKAKNILEWAFSDSKEEEKKVFMRRVLLEPSYYAWTSESKRGVILCKSYLGHYWHRDIFSPVPTREENEENFKKFINFFLKPYFNLEDFDDLKCKLKEWPDISKRYAEKIREDDPSTEDGPYEVPEEYLDWEYNMYCEKENCELFLSLLDSCVEK